MIELRLCSDKEEWDDYILENSGHPLQLWGWGQVKAGHGWTPERLFAYEDDSIVGAAQVLVRPLPFPLRAFSYIPRGPFCQPEQQDDFLAALADRMKQQHQAVTLAIEPDVETFAPPKGWVQATNKVLPAETIILDLKNSESDLLAGMAKKTRQYIRKSSADVTIRQAKTKEDIDTCLDLYDITAKRAGFNTHDRQYYRDVFLQMRDHSPVFMAEVNGEAVAFLWLAISEATAYELYGAVNELGQEVRANYALKWFAIRKMKEWGLSRYDFGGLIQGGVTVFKQGWSEASTTLAGTFEKPLSPWYGLWNKMLPLAKRISQSLHRR